MSAMANSFGSRAVLEVGKRKLEIHRLSALEKAGLAPARLPFSLRILLENLLRHEDGRSVKEGDIRALAGWSPKAEPSQPCGRP
jgi:aconitate hydratase